MIAAMIGVFLLVAVVLGQDRGAAGVPKESAVVPEAVEAAASVGDAPGAQSEAEKKDPKVVDDSPAWLRELEADRKKHDAAKAAKKLAAPLLQAVHQEKMEREAKTAAATAPTRTEEHRHEAKESVKHLYHFENDIDGRIQEADEKWASGGQGEMSDGEADPDAHRTLAEHQEEKHDAKTENSLNPVLGHMESNEDDSHQFPLPQRALKRETNQTEAKPDVPHDDDEPTGMRAHKHGDETEAEQRHKAMRALKAYGQKLVSRMAVETL